MIHRHSDKLARRVQRLEDRQRRELTALRNEVMGLLALTLPMPEVEVLTPRQVIARLAGRPSENGYVSESNT